jgi:DNA-binding NarL/FixJ family response regulator
MVLAPSGDTNLAMRSLDAGAIGFLTEDCNSQDIAEAVGRVAEGKPFLDPKLLQEVALHRISARGDPLVSLSAREYEIFRMLAHGSSVGDVAQALELSPRSVANYQTQIRRKLGVGTSAELVHLAIRCGAIHVRNP